MLLVAPAGTPFLTGGRSILVGQLFSSENRRLNELPANVRGISCATDLQNALAGYWGNFALFFATASACGAYRDPSGSVAVYALGGAASRIYVSDAELARDLGLLEQAIPDLRFAVHWLQFPFLRTRRTGLQGVSELLPGMLALRRNSRDWTEETAWHPRSFVRRGRSITDPEQAAARLKQVTLAVVAAQADCLDALLLRLSGGLDSSIIAACFAHAGISFLSANFATKSVDGDERLYAREMAAVAGSCLNEMSEVPHACIEVSERAAFRPGTNPLLLPFEHAMDSAARVLGASMLVDGAGGDNLFCAISTAAPVIDALRSALVVDAAGAVADIAERANCTLPEVVLAASRRLLKPRAPWNEDRSFLASSLLLASPELHPWLRDLHALPGKREHVEALVHIHHFLDRGTASTRLLHPLLAQPLVELCLQIPTWLWVRGGRDRAVARAAFAGILPASILRRRVKGSLQSMFHRSFAQLRDEMLEILASGELSSVNIIDVDSIRRALDGSSWESDEVQLRISEMVALELWLRFWRSQPACPSSGS